MVNRSLTDIHMVVQTDVALLKYGDGTEYGA